MKPIILPELLDKGDSIEGIPWRQLFIWGEPGKAESELETAKVMLDEYIRSASVSQSILRYSSTAFLERRKVAILPYCRNPSRNGCLICPWDCWILYTMLAAYDALLFYLNKEKKAHMSRAFCWRTFSASLVISWALSATEGTPEAFLLLHFCSHYDWSHSVLICVDSHVIEGSGIDEQKISQRLFSVAICLLPVWFLSINTFE